MLHDFLNRLRDGSIDVNQVTGWILTWVKHTTEDKSFRDWLKVSKCELILIVGKVGEKTRTPGVDLSRSDREWFVEFGQWPVGKQTICR